MDKKNSQIQVINYSLYYNFIYNNADDCIHKEKRISFQFVILLENLGITNLIENFNKDI